MLTETINIFKQLVTIDSPTGKEEKLVNFLLRYLKNKVNFVKKDSFGNIYARLNGNNDSFFLAAHLDTVEPGRNIKPIIKNGYITSDGTTILGADNKLTLACILSLINKLNTNKHKTIEFIFTKSEEIGNYGAINFDYSLLKSKIGYCFDTAQPIGTIVSSSPFYERFNLEIIGKEAHASRPENAINVLTLFNQLLNNIKLGKIDDDTLFNIGIVNCGVVRNTIPGKIFIKGEIRSFKEKKLIDYKNIFIKNLKKVISEHRAKYIIEFVRENPGYKLDNKYDLEMINKLKRLIISCGHKPEVTNIWGVSDANIFNVKGLKCINLGDGVEFPHTTNERIKIINMQKLLNLMIELSI